MINRLIFFYLLISLTTEYNFLNSKSGSKNEDTPKELADFVDIEPKDDVTSVDPGENYSIVITPKKRLRIIAEVKGFSILIGNMNLRTTKYSTHNSSMEEWEFAAEEANDYEIHYQKSEGVLELHL